MIRTFSVSIAASVLALVSAASWVQTGPAGVPDGDAGVVAAFHAANPGQSGYRLVFASRLSSRNEIDLADTRAPGFDWYVHPFLGGPPFNSGALNVSPAGLTLVGPTRIASGTVSESGQLVGRTFSGSAFFEATFTLGRRKPGPGAWPAFWSMAAEHIVGNGKDQDLAMPSGVAKFIEDDFFEDDTAQWAGPNSYGAALHSWSGRYKVECPTTGYCDVSNNGKAGHAKNFLIQLPKPIDWSKPHTIGQLLVTTRHGHTGFVQNYFDAQPVGTRTGWSASPADDYSPLDHQHLMLILQGGVRGATFQDVKVYQQ